MEWIDYILQIVGGNEVTYIDLSFQRVYCSKDMRTE